MSERYTIEHLLEIAQGDQELLDELFEAEILIRDQDLTQRDLERARVAYSLVREMDVNIAGVDVILRLREELLVAKRQLAELAELAKKAMDD
jgi:hypothetical protein